MSQIPVSEIDTYEYGSPPETLFQVLLRSRKEYGEKIAYIYKAGDEEVRVKYSKLLEDVLLLARSFEEKGVSQGDKVMFLADNRYAWMVTDLAIMSIGAVTVPRGSDTPSRELTFIIENSSCSHLVVENPDLLEYHKESLKSLKGLKNIFVMIGPAIHSLFSRTYSYQDLLKDRTYSDQDMQEYIERGNRIKSSDLLTVIYTSGTTGMPKGVRLTHANVMHNVGCIPGIIELSSSDTWLSILPSWHIFERTAEYVALAGGCCLVYSSVKHFAADLEHYRPTLVATVPRVWESLFGRVQIGVKKKGKTSYLIFFSAGLDFCKIQKTKKSIAE